MRELPLRVWKARRSEVISATSSGWSDSCASERRAESTTSRASSMKISRISGSSSSPLPPAGAGRGGGTGADTWVGSGNAGIGANPAIAPARSSRTAWRVSSSPARRNAVCALPIMRASEASSAAAACCDSTSSWRPNSVPLTPSCAAASTSDSAWSRSGAGAVGVAVAGASSKAAKAETRWLWPITALRLPVCGS